MRTLAFVASILVAGCGSGSPAFTPSQNLADTHAWLNNTQWSGTIRVDGIDYYFFLQFLGAMPTANSVGVYVQSAAPGISAGNSVFQADGDRVRIQATDTYTIPGEVTTTTYEGAVRQPNSMTLSWRRESTVAPFDGDTGTATLQLFSPLRWRETFEAYSTPEVLILLHTRERSLTAPR